MSEKRPTGWEGADRWFTPGDGAGAGEPAEPATPLTCAVCGAELEPDQTYCLECGSPTPLAPRLRRGGRTTAILAGAMIILGLGAGALAFAVVSNGDSSGTPSGTSGVTSPGGLVPTGTAPFPTGTLPATGPLPADTSVTTPTTPGDTTGLTSTGATGFDTVTGPSSTPTTAPEPTADSTTESTPAPSGDSDWPSGKTAWTAVLASVRSESDARSAKSRVSGGGDPAGVLFSTGFSGLRPGYWVVFSGIYPAQSTANAQALKLRPDFPGAYARRIEG